MKTCAKCKLDKPLSEYNKNGKRGLGIWCKTCFSEYHRERYKDSGDGLKKRLKSQQKSRRAVQEQKIVNYLKDNPCVKCGEANILKLDFDHIKQSEKEFEIMWAIMNTWGWDRIESEIKKCQILCANCHRVKTATEVKSWKLKYL
jgi:hypothetical protein